MSLTDTAVRNARARAEPYKLFDERGLFLFVKPGGFRFWRFKYRIAGREKLISFGVYPDVSLAKARASRCRSSASGRWHRPCRAEASGESRGRIHLQGYSAGMGRQAKLLAPAIARRESCDTC